MISDWNLMTGRRLIPLVLAAIIGSVATVDAAPYVYVANTGGGTVSVIDGASDDVVATITVGPSPEGLAVSPDGGTIYVANFEATTVSLIDAATNAVRRNLDGFVRPQQVAISRDGQRLYVSNSTLPGRVSVVDATSYAVIKIIEVGLFIPYGIAVSRDGRRVYITTRFSADERYPCRDVCMLPVFAFDTASDYYRATRYLDAAVDITLSADESRVFVAGFNGFWALGLPRLDFPRFDDAWSVPGSWNGAAAHPTSDIVYALSGEEIAVIQGTDGVVTDRIRMDSISLSALAVTPDGAKLYVSDYDTDTVLVLDTATKAVVGHVRVGRAPGRIAVGPENVPFTPRPSPSPTPPPCVGDGDGDGVVTVSEVMQCVNIALSVVVPPSCSACDGSGDGSVTVDDLLRSVLNLLNGCQGAS